VSKLLEKEVEAEESELKTEQYKEIKKKKTLEI